MKKMMTMACAALIAISANAQCNETKNEVKTIPFTQTKIDVPARVNFVVGDRFGFSVEAGDEVLSNLIECSVKDGVLTFTYGKDLEDADKALTKIDEELFKARIFRQSLNHMTINNLHRYIMNYSIHTVERL